MSDPVRFTVGAGEGGRADRVVGARFPGIGRRRVARLFAEGLVRVDGRVAKKGDMLGEGAEVSLERAPAADDERAARPEPGAALEVLHEDEDLVVIAKPAGVPSHPLRAGELGTIVNALVARYPECAGLGDDPREAGLAHRLDIGTSGVLVAARTADAWRRLREAFGAGQVRKEYLALVRGDIAGRGECEAPLAHRGRKMTVAYTADALPALTAWQLIERQGDYALLRCHAQTGRMHQIRAHLAHCGAPIVGDELYGGGAGPATLRHFFLHAERLELDHPTRRAKVRFVAPLPEDRRGCLEGLGFGPLRDA